eukprot:4007203-Amphidinium_carterae.1
MDFTQQPPSRSREWLANRGWSIVLASVLSASASRISHGVSSAATVAHGMLPEGTLRVEQEGRRA